MSNVASPSVPSNPILTPGWGAGTVGRTAETPVGGGTIGGAGGSVPELDAETVSDLRASLAELGLNMSPRQVEVLIVEIAVSMRDIETTTQNSKIKTDQAAMRERLAAQGLQIQEMETKQAEAREKKEAASTIDKVKLAFEWIGAVLAIAAAAIAFVVSPLTGGALAVVGALLIAASIAAIVSATDSTVTMATGHGIGYHACMSLNDTNKALGIPTRYTAEDAEKHDQAFKITIAVIGAVCGIAGGGASIVAAGRAAASASVRIATESAKWASRAVNAAEIGNNLGTTAANASSTVYTAQAQTLRADAQDLEADSNREKAFLNVLNDMIDQAFTRMLAASDRFNNVIDNIMETRNDRARFTARA